jgi:hypothetical protein
MAASPTAIWQRLQLCLAGPDSRNCGNDIAMIGLRIIALVFIALTQHLSERGYLVSTEGARLKIGFHRSIHPKYPTSKSNFDYRQLRLPGLELLISSDYQYMNEKNAAPDGQIHPLRRCGLRPFETLPPDRCAGAGAA